ncbi:hypothetical protein ACFL0G_01245 [Candidatus Zixiibacteriota bacterium]
MRDHRAKTIITGLLTAATVFILACGGTAPEIDTGNDHLSAGDREFVARIKSQIHDQVLYQDVKEDIGKFRGKVVKWDGDIVHAWDDKLLMASQNREGSWDHFILLLDHPLPEDRSIVELIQTISTGDAIYALGRIIDRRTIVLESGSYLTIPHLDCFVISKDNDREFARPVWVGNRR